jgi:hypothetical protein
MAKRKRNKKRKPPKRRSSAPDRSRKQFAAEMAEFHRNVAPNAEMVDSINGLPPLSDRIMTIGAPWIESTEGYNETHNLTLTAVAAWNASLGDGAEGVDGAVQALVDGSGVHAPPEAKHFLREVVEGMVARKRKMFPEDRRAAVHFKINISPDGEDIHLHVASLWSPDWGDKPLPPLPGGRPALFSLLRHLARGILARMGFK